MFRVIKKKLFVTATFLVSSVNSLECISIKNQECKVREEIISVNDNEPLFYPFSIKVNKCSGSCNNIKDSYARLCVPDVIKNMNLKVFNLMSQNNQTRQIKLHESCRCKYKLNSSVCKNKQKWNKGKCRRECKRSVDKQECDEGFIWNPSNCECECDKSCNKSCDVGEYLEYKNCQCKKRIIDKLVEECSENIDKNETLDAIPLNVYKKECNSCMVYIVLFVAFLITKICICCAFIYFYGYLKKDNISNNFCVGYLNI